MDEPCRGLDPHNYHNLIEVFAGLSQTLVFSTCNMQFAADVADRVVVLYNG
jgi:energy-coupling factor transporter ATP-binding protein EcfA2